LEEIDNIFADSNPWKPWDVVGIAARLLIRHPTLNQSRRSSVIEETLEIFSIAEIQEKSEIGCHKE